MRKKSFWEAAEIFVTGGCALLVGGQLLVHSEAVAAGVRQSLAICGSILIPSLFPFMVLAAFLPATAAGRGAARPAAPIGRVLYGLPSAAARTLAPALLMSWLGGYPAGARALAVLVEQGRISRENAGRALCFCVNGGPAFVVTVVGVGVFGSRRLGLALFACQLLAGAVTARLLLGREGIGSLPRGGEGAGCDKTISAAITSAVSSASAGIISICTFVLLCGTFAALLNFSDAPSMVRVLLEGGLEISMGAAGAKGLSPEEALSVLPFLLSFSGLSCILQVMAIAEEQCIPTGRFLLSRPLQGALTQLFAYLLLRGECAALPAGLITAPALACDPRTPVGTLLLLAMCAMLFLTPETDG